MGASNSLAEKYGVVKNFNEFIKNAKSVKKSSLLSTIKGPLETLREQAEEFFTAYEQSSAFKSIPSDNDKSIDLNKYFEKIVFSIEAFQKCVDYIDENKKKGEITTVLNDFRNDFRKFVKQLVQFAETATNLITNIKIDPLSMTEFYLELDIFDFALNVQQLDIPPYYVMSTLPVYELRDKIMSTKQRYLSIISQHSSGKTTLVPLFLMCRILKTKMAKYLIVVEHDMSMIRDIVSTYRNILERHRNDDKSGVEEDGEEEDEEFCVEVTSSVTRLHELVQDPPYLPVIGVLTPSDAVHLVHIVDDLNSFTSKSVFVIDDFHRHTVETDVLTQDLQRSINKIKKKTVDPRFVLMSVIQDDPLLNYVRYYDDIRVKNTNTKVERKEVKCKSIADITRKSLFNQMNKFFDTWREDSEYNIGSVVVFVPSEKIGRRLYKQIFKFYNKENSIKVHPLPTTIRKGEKIEDFYIRLNDDIDTAEADKPEKEDEEAADDEKVEDKSDEAVPTLYLMPVFLSQNVTKEEIKLVQSQLPVPLIDRVSRVFITTIKNESILSVNDLMVIFDTGVEEVDFFDPNQGTIHVKEQLLPKTYMEMHRRMLGRSGDGVYFEFNAEKTERPKDLIPSVKRSDLSRQLLSLRSFGVKLEKETGLPIEPDRRLLDSCFEILQRIGLIADTKEKELTEQGKEAARYPGISPILALATSKFGDNKQFAYLCSLIIEYSRILVIDSGSKLLCKNFKRESDIVTLLESIREVCSGLEEGYQDCGLSLGTIYSMCMQIELTFNEKDGSAALINAVNWSKTQPGGILGMVDKFVALLDQNEFLNKRKCSFVHVLGAGPRSEPTLVYKANEIFKFPPIESKRKKAEEIPAPPALPPPPPQPEIAKIKFTRRPGWLGLQSPGNVVVLSLIVEENSRFNRGLIVHRDSTATVDSPGVMSLQVDNPSLNSFFFVSLFEAYWSDHNTVNDFIGIYHSQEARDDSVFLIHMTESDGKNYLNYCPKNTAIENSMKAAIPLLSSLMPFVPRSIIAKVDNPICAIEVTGYGCCNNFTTAIHLIAEADSDKPFAYPINKAVLEYARNNIAQLKNSQPLIRFSITGESLYYKSIGGRELEAELTYPDVTPNLQSVFDPNHQSHLVLLVDKNFPNKPPVPAMNWLPPAAAAAAAAAAGDDADDTEDNKMLVSVASKIMTGMGYAEKLADLFYITLGGGYPTAGEGKVPDAIKNKVGYEGNAIKQGIYPLVHHFVREFMTKQKLSKDIELKQLSSTNAWRNYPANEEDRQRLCEQVSRAVANQFHLKEDEVMCSFLGPSMLALRVEKLPENLVSHKQSMDIWNPTYQPCVADGQIANAIRGIGTVDFQVTTVVHEPTINIHVRNMKRLLVSNDKFEDTVKKLGDQFGFLKVTIPELSFPDGMDEESMGIKGKIDVELIGMASGIVFATLITKAFPMKDKEESDMNRTMVTCVGMTTFNPRLGPAPDIGIMDQAVRVSPDEIEALKELIAAKNQTKKSKRSKWKLDTNFNVLIVPATEEAAMKEMMRKVRDKENDTTCQYMCAPPQVFLPQSLYLYDKDGSVKTLAICKQCIIEYFRGMEELQQVMDPLTHLIDRNKLKNLNNNMKGFCFYADSDDGAETWPQIPFGQGVWALMSDAENIGPYIKAWFTAIIDFIVKRARNYFTSCPNHPDIILRTPKPGISIKCAYCNQMYHYECQEWHDMNKACDRALAPGVKISPCCRTKTVKTSGCNHITCPCGKHWCYKCGNASPIFNTAGDCYSHLTAAHGGYYT